MTCQECTEFLFEEIDRGEFNRAAVVHLSECEDCRDLARELRANAAALRSMRDDVVPVQAVMAPLLVPAMKKRPNLVWLAAAAAVILVVGAAMWRPGSGTSPLSSGENKGEPIQQPAVAMVLPEIAAKPESRIAVRASSQRPAQTGTQLRAARLVAAFKAQSDLPTGQSPIKIITADPNVVIFWLAPDQPIQETSEGQIL